MIIIMTTTMMMIIQFLQRHVFSKNLFLDPICNRTCASSLVLCQVIDESNAYYAVWWQIGNACAHHRSTDGAQNNHIIGISEPGATTMTKVHLFSNISHFKAFSWEKGYPVLRSFLTVLEVNWCCVLNFSFSVPEKSYHHPCEFLALKRRNPCRAST